MYVKWWNKLHKIWVERKWWQWSDDDDDVDVDNDNDNNNNDNFSAEIHHELEEKTDIFSLCILDISVGVVSAKENTV